MHVQPFLSVQTMVPRWSIVASVIALTVATTSAVPLDEFYPYADLPDNQTLMPNDDDSSRGIHLDPPLWFYGRNYSTCNVSNNGIISFNKPPEHFINDPFPLENYILVAPFFGDVDTRGKGKVWYTNPVSNDRVSLDKAKEDIGNVSGCDMFSPKYLVIATWDHVGYYREQTTELNTFQCVIAADGNQSYAIFLYNETEWTTSYDPDHPNRITTPAKVGFNDGYLNKSWEVPCSRTPEIVNISMSSNVGRPGVWIFRIDEEEITPACLTESKDEISTLYQAAECSENETCYNGQTCLTANYELKCTRSNQTCKKPPDREEVKPTEKPEDPNIGLIVGVIVSVIIVMSCCCSTYV